MRKSRAAGIFIDMSKPTRPTRSNAKRKSSSGSAGPIAFFVALFIIALGAIQLVSTFHTYALNLSELNGLKRDEAALVARKQKLENEIERWNDDAYVTAQARERLGFVFPGEQAIRVLNPQAVTGTQPSAGDTGKSKDGDAKSLPWYSELAYSFEKADQGNDGAETQKTDDVPGVGNDAKSDGGGDTR